MLPNICTSIHVLGIGIGYSTSKTCLRRVFVMDFLSDFFYLISSTKFPMRNCVIVLPKTKSYV